MRVLWRSVGAGLLGLIAAQAVAAGADPPKAGVVVLDLSKAGEIDNGKNLKGPWKMTIEAPKGAAVQVVGIPGSIGSIGHGLLITDGSGFSLTLCAATGNPITDKKKEWAKDKATRKLVIDEADTLMREIVSPPDKKTPAYHFIKYKKIGGREFTVEDRTAFGAPKPRGDFEMKCADTLAAGE